MGVATELERLREEAAAGDLDAAAALLRAARRLGAHDLALPEALLEALIDRAAQLGDLHLELDALTRLAPSPTRWTALWQRAATLDDHALAELEALLDARWPDALRRLPDDALRELVDLAVDVRGMREGERRAPREEPRWRLARRLHPPIADRRIHFGLAGLRRLCACASLTGLRELGLAHQNQGAAGPPGAWLEPLIAAGHLRHVRDLDLRRTRLHDRGLARLGTADHLGSVRRLVLAENGLGDAAVRDFLDTPLADGLEVLLLDQNQLGAAGCAALGTAPALARLERLALGGNPLGAAGCAALAEASRFGALRDAHLGAAGIDAAAASALASAPWLARLEKLDLGNNPLEAAGISAITEVLRGGPLRELSLVMCQLDPAAMGALAATELPALRRLRLGANPVDTATVRTLLDAPWAPGLETLCLRLTTLGVESLRCIAESTRLESLRTLEVDDFHRPDGPEMRLLLLRSRTLPAQLRAPMLAACSLAELRTMAGLLALNHTARLDRPALLARVAEALPDLAEPVAPVVAASWSA